MGGASHGSSCPVRTCPFDLITSYHSTYIFDFFSVIAAAASEPEANERGSSLIDRRLIYRGLKSLFLTKREELWLWANGGFRMRSGIGRDCGYA